MGWEVNTAVRCGGDEAVCRVQLEGGEIILRGALKRRFKFAAMRELGVRGGRLEFNYEPHLVSIELGNNAAAWLDAIRNPRTRVQKLGATAGIKTCLLGAAEAEVAEELAQACGGTASTRLSRGCDLVLLFADKPKDLERLSRIEDALADGGAVWVLWPKGRREFAHEHVVQAARDAGLVQTRSMGFSELRTGLRLVRPKAGKK